MRGDKAYNKKTKYIRKKSRLVVTYAEEKELKKKKRKIENWVARKVKGEERKEERREKYQTNT
jgi:hypothetical protein